MQQIVSVTHAEQLRSFTRSSELPVFDFDNLSRHKPDAHWLLLENDVVLAHASLWWLDTPLLDGERIGAIGHYAACNAAAARTIIQYSCRQLKQRGCKTAVAPMDGNTWRNYRFLSERGTEQPFFLEPRQPDSWPQDLMETGFTPLAHYTSTLCEDLNYEDPRIGRVRERLTRAGVGIRGLQIENIEAELRRIYSVCRVSFAHNFLYMPLDEREFIGQYQRVLPYVRPQLVLLAERDNETVGFAFSLPDTLQAARDEAVNTVIVKTVAVLPQRDFAGLGNLLTAQTHSAARGLGYTRSIHALMHDANRSLNVSTLYARPMRGYTLYARRLDKAIRLP